MAFILFRFASRLNEAGDSLACLLEMSSLTILFGLFLKSDIVFALAIAFLLVVICHSSFHGNRVIYVQI